MLRHTILAFVALCIAAPLTAQAQEVQVWDTTGSQTLKVDGLGSDTQFFGVDLTLIGARKFEATTSDGDTFKGTYKRKKAGKKLIFKLKKSSVKKLRKRLEAYIESFGFDDADIDDMKTKFTGKVNEAGDAITLKGKVKFEGDADGEDGEGDWKFKTSGPLVATS